MAKKKKKSTGKAQSAPRLASGIYDARELGTSRMLILGLQHMFAMFGATVLVPVLTGLPISATLLFAGLGTLLFHFLTKGMVPAFLGSRPFSRANAFLRAFGAAEIEWGLP